MSVLKSGQDYLEAILMLSKKTSEVHAIDIVNLLGFSKPSVSIALKKLQQEGYLTIDSNSHIFLTEKGKAIASDVYERHVVITSILVKLGVSPEVAEEDACKVEHDISEETFNALKKAHNKLN